MTSTPARRLTLGQRLLIAQVCVLVAMAATIVGTAAFIGPHTFHTHMSMVTGSHDPNIAAHAEMGFRDAGALSLMVGLGIALLGAIVTNLVILRRVHTTLVNMAHAARCIAAGEITTVVNAPHTGSEIDSLARSLNDLAHQLAATEKARRRMLTDLAHEMRTPLAALDLSLQALQDGVRSATPETVVALREHTSRLTRLVTDIRDVSAAQEGAFQLQPERTDVEELFVALHGAMQPAYAAKGVNLHLDAPEGTTVFVDPDRVSQILINLLSNALRHTPAGGSVVVSTTTGTSQTTITVADTGEGIDPVDQPHLFERFYRADTARGRVHAGTGVGLSISKALADAHGGTLTVHSLGVGFGASFSLTVPTVASPQGISPR